MIASREIMSEHVYAEPDITKQVHFDQDNVVGIYVSAESLRVYENPWVEGTSPNIHGPAQHQHTVSVVSENSERRTWTRTDSVFQRASCLLLLAVILALIVLGVKMKNDKTNWRNEKEQLQAEKTNLENIRDQLTANNTELSKQIDCLRRTFCEKKPKKCKDCSKKKEAGNGSSTSTPYTFYINRMQTALS